MLGSSASVRIRRRTGALLIIAAFFSILSLPETAVGQADLSAPTNLAVRTVSNGGSTVVMQWTAVANASGYVATATPSGGGSDVTGTVNGTNTQATFTGLNANTAFTISVRATGDGTNYESEGAAETLVVPALPAALQDLTGFALAPSRVAVVWTQPTDPSITRYERRRALSLVVTPSASVRILNPWQRIAGATAVSYRESISGSNITGYFAEVRAVNVRGAGPTSSQVRVVFADVVPDAPSNLQAEAGNTRVRLTWTQATRTNVTGYDYTLDGGANWMPITGGSMTTASYTVTGLTNGTSYRFRVRARSASGAGVPSNIDVATPVEGESRPLRAPSNLRVQPGTLSGTEFKVTWNKVSGATGYEAVATKVSDTSTTVTGTVVGTTATFTGLEGETGYSVSVLATSDGFFGYEERGAAAILAAATRSAPPQTLSATFNTNTGVLTIRGLELTQSALDSIPAGAGVGLRLVNVLADNQRKGTSGVKWTSGGVTRTYELAGGADCAAAFCGFAVPLNMLPLAGRATLELTFTDNPHGISSFPSDFAVVWSLDFPGSEFSTTPISNVVVGAPGPSAPSAPTGLQAQAGNAQVTLSWNDPVDSSITKYQYSSDSGATWTDVAGSGARTTSHMLTGLTNRQRHTFWVRAVNAQGDGDPAGVSVLVLEVPTPENLRVAPRDGGVDLQWDSLRDSNLRYEYTQDSGVSWQSTENRHYPRVRISGLTNGQVHTFRVRAIQRGVAGRASRSVTVIPGPLPAVLKGLTAVRGDGEVTLSWDDPDTPEPWVTKYQYLRGPRWTDVPQSGPATRSFTLTGIDNSVSLRIYVRAVAGLDNSGAARGGELSRVFVDRVPEPLVAVTGLTAMPGATQVELAWASHPDLDVTGYEVSQDGGSTWAVIPGFDALPSRPTHTVTGLTNGTEYRFGVRPMRGGMAGPAAWVTATAGEAAEPTVSVRADRLEVDGGGEVRLTGSGSVEGGTVTYVWAASSTAGTFENASVAETTWTAPTATASEQSVTLTLTATVVGSSPANTVEASLTVTVRAMPAPVSNSPPVITAPTTAARDMVMHGSPLSVTVTATDPDGDALTYWASSSDDVVVTVMPSEATDLKSGTSAVLVTQQGDGTATVTVMVSDGTATATRTFAVTVGARDLPAPDNLVVSSRWLEDDDTMSLMEVTWGAVTGAEDYEVTATPINPAGQARVETVTGPSASFTDLPAGTYMVSVQPQGDGALYEAAGEVVATDSPHHMTNRAPTLVAGTDPNNIVPEQRVGLNTILPRNVGNKNVDVSVAFSDPNGDTLTYTAARTASGVVWVVGVDGSNVVLRGLGTTGTETITVTADDGRGGTVEGSFDVVVALEAPVVTLIPGPGQLTVNWASVDEAHPFYTLQWRDSFYRTREEWGDTNTTTVNVKSGYVIENLNPRFLYDVRVRALAPQNLQEGTWSTVVTGGVSPVVLRQIQDRVIEQGNVARVYLPAANDAAFFSGGDKLEYTAASSNERVATVEAERIGGDSPDSRLIVTGVGGGTATITVTATVEDTSNSTSQTFEVRVIPAPAPRNLRVVALNEGGEPGVLRVEWTPAVSERYGYLVCWEQGDQDCITGPNGASYRAQVARVVTPALGFRYRHKITGLKTDGTTYVVRVYTFVSSSSNFSRSIREAASASALARPLPVFSIASDSVLRVMEGDTANPNAEVKVKLSYAPTSAVSVDYITVTGTAWGGIRNADYTAKKGTLNFAPGEDSKTITVAILDDNLDEPFENFQVRLRRASRNAMLLEETRLTTVTIDDNDGGPQFIALSVPANTVVWEGASVAKVRVTATVEGSTRFGSKRTVQVVASVPASGSNLVSSSDFTSQQADLVFYPGDTSTSAVLSITPTNDDLIEGHEALEVSGSVVGGGVTVRSATLTLTDDNLPVLRIADASAAEGGQMIFTVTRDPETNTEVTVDYATQGGGTATADMDHAVRTGTVTFAAGETSGTFTVRVFDDSLDEDDETFVVVLGNPSGAALVGATALGTIVDTDDLPTLALENPTAVLSGSEGGTISSDVLLSPASGREVRVHVNAIIPSGTATYGIDYGVAGTLVFAAGETRQTFRVNVYDDALDEGDETFSLRLDNARNAEISSSAETATGTIMDNDASPTISIADASPVQESRFGSRIMVFDVSMSRMSGRAVTVEYYTLSGTANSGNDFGQQNGTLVFIAGSRSNLNEIRIEILDDQLYEGEETFSVVLRNPSGATLLDDRATGTIEDDEEAPGMSIADARVGESQTPRRIDFEVSLSVASSSAVTADYETREGSATDGTAYGDDYTETTGTLTFAPGETRQTIRVPFRNDAIYEGDESFTVVLSNLSGDGVSFSRDRATGTIVDNELPLFLSIADTRVTEGNAGSGDMVFTVSLSPESDEQVSVDIFELEGFGTATAGTDYQRFSRETLIFAPGDTRQTFTVQILGDIQLESDETIVVFLDNPVGAQLGTSASGQRTGTIVNDETLPAISIADAEATESRSSRPRSMFFTVTLSEAKTWPVSVNYATADGTATKETDYLETSDTLRFAAGETSKTISVPILKDTEDENDETFTVTLSRPHDATLGDATATGTIKELPANNDPVITEISNQQADVRHVRQGGAFLTVPVHASDSDGDELEYWATLPRPYAANVRPHSKGILAPDGRGALEIGTLKILASPQPFMVTLHVYDGEMMVEQAFQVDPSLQLLPEPADLALKSGTRSSNGFRVTWTGVNAVAKDDYEASAVPVSGGSAVDGELVDGKTEAVFSNLSPEASYTVSVRAVNGVLLGYAEEGRAATLRVTMPTLSISPTTLMVPEGDSGNTPQIFTVLLDPASSESVEVAYTTADVTAEAGTDYTAANGTLTFAAGDSSKTITVAITGDEENESDETFTVALSSATGDTTYISSTENTATVTVEDDDRPALSIADAIMDEGDSGTTNMMFAVMLDEAVAQQITVTYATSDGTATTAGTDYTAVTGTLTFAPSSTRQTFNVPIIGDVIYEEDETFTVTLSGSSTNVRLGDPTATGTITNDEASPTLSIAPSNVTVIEGGSGTDTQTSFTVTMSLVSSQQVTVAYATVDDTATVADTDYVAANGTLTFVAGETSKTITVQVTGDDDDEGDETFMVRLSNASGSAASIPTATGTATVTIVELPALSVADASRNEGDSGTASMEFTVMLDMASNQQATVAYATSDGTATTADTDYTAANGTLTFAAGETMQTFNVPIIGDVIYEEDETFTVTLSSPSSGVRLLAAGTTATGTISNDEDLPILSIVPSSVSVPEGDSGTTTQASFTVTMLLVSSQQVTVGYETVDGTATVADADYVAANGTLTFVAGETSKVIAVQVSGDDNPEGDETFTVSLSNPSGASISTTAGTATATIRDLPALSIANASISEGDSDTSNMEFTVTLSEASRQQVTVSYATSDGTATAGTDYTAVNGTLTFAVGEAVQTFNVPIIGDEIYESPDETFTVTLSDQSSGARLPMAETTAMGTIIDNEGPPELRIEGAEAREGASGMTTAMIFTVTLSLESSQQVVVNYATADGTGADAATAGEDYTAITAGTLTFAPGERIQTFVVLVLGDDEADERAETFTVTLSGPSGGATLENPTATGTIQSILGRLFEDLVKEVESRSALVIAENVADAIEQRIRTWDAGLFRSELRVAGRAVRPNLQVQEELPEIRDPDRLGEEGTYTDIKPTVEQLFDGTSFVIPLRLNAGTDGVRQMEVWGRGSWRSMDGDDDRFNWDGSQRGAQFGIDTQLRENLLAGLAVSWSDGEFDYKDEGLEGAYDNEMLSVHPWMAWSTDNDLDLWASLGYGEGEFTLEDEDYKSDATLKMAAVGVSGLLLEQDRMKVVLKSEGIFADVDIDDSDFSDVDANRVRVAVEGSWLHETASGGYLTPSLEIGMRADSGDNAPGTGAEVGAGVAFEDSSSRLSLDLNGRLLVINGDVLEHGLSGGVSYKPDSAGRGLSLTLHSGWGVALSGMEQLWETGASDIADMAEGSQLLGGRMQAEIGYGVGYASGLLTSYGGIEMEEDGDVRYRVGSRYTTSSSLELSLGGVHETDSSESNIMLKGTLRW